MIPPLYFNVRARTVNLHYSCLEGCGRIAWTNAKGYSLVNSIRYTQENRGLLRCFFFPPPFASLTILFTNWYRRDREIMNLAPDIACIVWGGNVRILLLSFRTRVFSKQYYRENLLPIPCCKINKIIRYFFSLSFPFSFSWVRIPSTRIYIYEIYRVMIIYFIIIPATSILIEILITRDTIVKCVYNFRYSHINDRWSIWSTLIIIISSG